MKRLAQTFALALFVFCSAEVIAQGNFHLGVKGIPQNTWLLNQADSDSGNVAYVSTWNYAYGLSLGYHWNQGIGIQIDVLNSRQGQIKEYGTRSFRVELETALSYLKVPVLFSFSSDPSKKSMFYGNVGPQFSLLQKASYIDEDGMETESITVANVNSPSGFTEVEIKEGFNSLDIGVVFALGGRFMLSESMYLSTGVRLDYGLTDAEDKDFSIDGGGFYVEDRPTTSNALAGFEIGLSYIFGEKLSD